MPLRTYASLYIIYTYTWLGLKWAREESHLSQFPSTAHLFPGATYLTNDLAVVVIPPQAQHPSIQALESDASHPGDTILETKDVRHRNVQRNEQICKATVTWVSEERYWRYAPLLVTFIKMFLQHVDTLMKSEPLAGKWALQRSANDMAVESR